MLTDNSGGDISWVIQKEIINGIFGDYFGRGAAYGDPYASNKDIRENYCFPKGDQCWRFAISDNSGDGLCCANGDGGYKVTYAGEIQKSSRFKDKAQESFTFGNCDSAEEKWTKIGQDIIGSSEEDALGNGVSLSDDGTRLAIGAPGLEKYNAKGKAYVYEYVSGVWSQLGQTLRGESTYDEFGYSISLSGDGNHLAVGAPKNDGSGTNSGHVRVFEYITSSDSWVEMGTDIDGEAANDNFGESVSLSKDGLTVAIGGDNNNGNNGHVEVYRFESVDWFQSGLDIDSEDPEDFFGRSVSLSADGLRVAAGGPYNDATGVRAGHARIFDAPVLNFFWEQVGGDIDGENPEDLSGDSVSLSADGTRVAIGSPYNDGQTNNGGSVRVFDLIGNIWSQVGGDIDGSIDAELSGRSISLSNDGTILAIGSPNYRTGGFTLGPGRVKVFRLEGSSWVQLGSIIRGEEYEDVFGESVSLSADGRTLAIGAIEATYYGCISGGRGYVQVYSLD